MNTQKFLEEFGLIEAKIREKLGSDTGSKNFSNLIELLGQRNLADEKLLAKLDSLRQFRNKVSSSQDVGESELSGIEQVILEINSNL